MNEFDVIIAYFGPETVFPVTSIIATCLGVILMFGRRTYQLVIRWILVATFHRRSARRVSGPHFRIGRGAARQAGVTGPQQRNDDRP
jgi:hypothetical protein